MRTPRSHSCKSVLIVDDNPWIRKVLCERFQRGADLVVCGEAENGKEAIEKAQQLRPELIDLSMPVINGLDAARILRRLMPSVPLIMYSAFGDKLIERQARLIGIRELVPKSQDAAVLISKARSLLTPKGKLGKFARQRGCFSTISDSAFAADHSNVFGYSGFETQPQLRLLVLTV